MKLLQQLYNRISGRLNPNKSDFLKGAPFWIAAVLTAFFSFIYSKLFTFAEHQFLKIFSHNPYIAFIICPLGFLIAWYLVYRIAPNAKGSGIPQVLASIELTQSGSSDRKTIRHLVSLPITLVKALSSFIVVLCGGAIGREGPTIQISAYIFHSIGCKFSKVWQPPTQDIYFIAGGAAGIAAAFNTPLGGVVYAIEELSKTSFHKFRTSLFTAVIISGVVAQILSGPYLFIGAPKMHAYSSSLLPYSILIGVIAGIFGAVFGKFLFLLSELRRKITNPIVLAGLAVTFGLMIAIIIVFINPHAAGSGKTLVISYLFKNEPSSLEHVFVRFISPILTYSSGTAGGVFSPSLSAGASIGAYIADIFSTQYKNTFIVLGMIGFLSGFTAAPFTSFLLILEMTDRHSIIFSMMLTSLSAYAVSQAINKKSFYELMRDIFVEEEINLKNKDTNNTKQS